MREAVTALVIEDDDDIRRLLELVLESSGLAVTSAASGAAGVDLALAGSFDLISVDLGLPDLDGTEVVARLRGSVEGRIVVISARSTESDRARALAAGADLFLTKPFRPKDVRAQLATLLA